MPKLPDSFDLGRRPTPQPTTSGANFNNPQVAQALAQLGQTAARIGDEFQQTQDQQALLQKRAGFVDFEAGLKQDALSKRGADAANLPQQVSQAFDTYAAQQEGTLRTEPQRRAFRELAVSRKLGLLDWTNTYASGQRQQYLSDSYNANIASARQDALNNAKDPASVQNNLTLQDMLTRQYLKTQGAAPETIEQTAREEQGKTVTGVAEGLLANGDYKAAQGYFDAYKDVLPGPTQESLSNRIDQFRAPALAEEIYNRNGGDLLAARRDAAVGVLKASLRSQVEGELLRLDGTIGQARRVQLSLTEQDAAQAQRLLDTPGVALTPAAQQQIDSTLRQLRSMSNNTPIGLHAGRMANELEAAQKAYATGAAMLTLPLDQQKAFLDDQIAKLPQANSLEDAAQAQLTRDYLQRVYTFNANEIRTDPYTALARQTGQAPPAFNVGGDVTAQLEQRLPLVAQMRGRWAINAPLFTPDEAKSVAAQLQALPPTQRVDILTKMGKVSDPAAVSATFGQLASNNPWLAQIGTYGTTGRQAADGSSVADLIATGSDLLSARYDATGKEVAKPKFTFAEGSKEKFDAAFDNYVGSAFAGNAAARQVALDGVRAVYAAYAQRDGALLSGKVDPENLDAFDKAAKAYFGGDPVQIGRSQVFAPYGMDAGTFRSSLTSMIRNGMQRLYSPDQIRSAINRGQLVQVAPNMYRLIAPAENGRNFEVQDGHGRPMIFSASADRLKPPADVSDDANLVGP